MIEPITFDDEPFEGSPSTPADATTNLGLGAKEEKEDGESSESDGDFTMEELEDY